MNYKDHVRQRLAAYEYPRLIDFVHDIPTTTTGKIKRDELRRRESRNLLLHLRFKEVHWARQCEAEIFYGLTSFY